MKKFSSTLCALACIFSATSAAYAIDVKPNDKFGMSADIDNVLNELSRQQNLSSTIFPPSNEPSSLAANSSLIKASDDSIISEADTDNDLLTHLTLVASNAINRFKQAGRASWYGTKFHGRKTASGERFNMNALTAAHRSLPFNTHLKVTNKDNGKSVIVKVNDRGPFSGSRVIDLSYAAAKKIGLVSRGTGNVSIERINTP